MRDRCGRRNLPTTPCEHFSAPTAKLFFANKTGILYKNSLRSALAVFINPQGVQNSRFVWKSSAVGGLYILCLFCGVLRLWLPQFYCLRNLCGSVSPFFNFVCWAVTHPPPALKGGSTAPEETSGCGKAARKRAATVCKSRPSCASGAVTVCALPVRANSRRAQYRVAHGIGRA